MHIPKNKIIEINKKLYGEDSEPQRSPDKTRQKKAEDILSGLKKKYAGKVKVTGLISENAYIARLQILSVNRKLYPGRHAYKTEKDISADGQIPVTLNKLPLRNPPEGFREAGEAKEIVPGTEHLIKCGKCSGSGKTAKKQDCRYCAGSGRMAVCVYYDTSYSPEFLNAVFSPKEIPPQRLKKEDGTKVFDSIIYEGMEDVEDAWKVLRGLGHIAGAVKEMSETAGETLKSRENSRIYRMKLKLWRLGFIKAGYLYRNKKRYILIREDGRIFHKNNTLFRQPKTLAISLSAAVCIIAGILYVSRNGPVSPAPAGEPPAGETTVLMSNVEISKTVKETPEKRKEVPAAAPGISEREKEDREKKQLLNETVESRKKYFNSAVSQHNSGKFGEAYESIHSAIKLNEELQGAQGISPPDSELYFQLGRILTGFGDFDGAISSHKKALQHNPDNAAAAKELERVSHLKSILENSETE